MERILSWVSLRSSAMVLLPVRASWAASEISRSRSSRIEPGVRVAWRTSGEVGIEHSHHSIPDPLRELSSPCVFAWQCLSLIAGITDPGAERT